MSCASQQQATATFDNISNNKEATSDRQEQHSNYTASCCSFAILFYELRVPVICMY